MRATLGASSALLLGLAGCSAPAACTEERGSDEPNLVSEGAHGLVSLDEAVRSARLPLRLTLSNLPLLWQGTHNVFSGAVQLEITTEYASAPRGNDGKTEMPRVSATLALEDTNLSSSAATGEYAKGSATSRELPLFFNGCSNDHVGPGCCPYGVRECSLLFTLSVERLDGAPFPPVEVAWNATANAHVTSCPLDEQVQAELTLSEATQ